MAKKRRTPQKNNKKIAPIPIDCIPKYSQQPRSSPPKRRTDFSIFKRTPSSLFNPGSSTGSSSDEMRLSNFIASRLQERRREVKQLLDDTLVRCSNNQEGRPVCSSGFSNVPNIEVDSAVQDEVVDLGDNRDTSNEKVDPFKMSESTPRESSVSESSCFAVTPGSVVWARTASQKWWPAEIMEERSTLSDPVSDGHVLVQFYGNHSSAWIDPMTDISTFEDSFQERSNNPSEDFQEALKQALQRKEQLISSRKLSPDRCTHSDQQDRSSVKCTSPTSSRTISVYPKKSRTISDLVERRRGKRERKRKVHFDEVTLPMKSERKDRRLRIMRYLGLAAPVGSPF